MNNNISIGHLIKNLRYEKKLKQAVLAEGICSVSYLSKIENNIEKPSIKMQTLLLDKLEYKIADTSLYQNKINHLYQLILRSDLLSAEKLYQEFQEIQLSGLTLTSFHIVSIFLFIAKEDISTIPALIEGINESSEMFSTSLKYYFSKAQGMYYYYLNDLVQSVSFFKYASDLSKTLVLSEEEKADLHFVYAQTTCYLGMYSTCLIDCHISLAYYQTSYHIKRCIECHMLLGFAYKETYNIIEGIKHCEVASNLAKKISYDKVIPTIQQYLGTLYGINGDAVRAISTYSQILEQNIKLEPNQEINIIICLVKELYKTKSHNEAKMWLSKGLYIIEKEESVRNESISKIKFYRCVLTEDYHSLDKIMYNDIIPNLEKTYSYLELSNYCEFMGDHFFGQGKYKKAAIYFAHSHRYFKNTMHNSQVQLTIENTKNADFFN